MNETSRWNLRKMFPEDQMWMKKMEETSLLAQQLASRKGTCASSAEELVKTAEQYLTIDQNLYDLIVFANSNFDQNMADAQAKKLYEISQNAATEIGEMLSFLAPELMQYSMEVFDRYCAECPHLEQYRFFAQDFFLKKEHTLSDEMETMLVRMSDMGSSFGKIYEDLMINDVKFPVITDPNGKDYQVTEAGYGAALSNPDREFRKNYYKALLGTYGKHINTLTSAYYGSVKGDVFTAKTRKYNTVKEMRLFHNHIPEQVYDNLLKTVEENTKPLQDYVEYRRQKMGLDEIHFYDLFVPMIEKTDREYTYEEAQQLILKATAVLGDDYTKLVQRAFDERWIDVYPRENKRTGAYSTGSYTSAPYVLLNFTGTLNDVFTLAHELGHSMHTYFSCKSQPFIYSGYSIFCAEVASTVNEELLSDYLYRHAQSDKERALLLDKKLNDLRSTFYRQTMFAAFEDETHKLVERNEPLLPETLCDLHERLNRIYYGDRFIIDPQLRYEWSRIPHFYRAFYVYQYATGISAATAICKKILTQGKSAVEDYRKFLSGGGSRHPIDMLRVAGVDMASPQPVLDTVEVFRNTLEQLKGLQY